MHRTWNVFQQYIVLQFPFCFLRQGSPSVSCAVHKGNISSLFYLTIIPLTKKKIATIITCCLPIIFYKASSMLVMHLCSWLIILTLGKKADCEFSTYHTNATWPAGGMLQPIIAQTDTRSIGAVPILCQGQWRPMVVCLLSCSLALNYQKSIAKKRKLHVRGSLCSWALA